MYKLEQLSAHFGRRIDKVVNIMDVKGVGLGHRKLLKFMRHTTFMDQYYYPEMLGNLYIVNSPHLFPALWSIAKTFVDPVTQSKIKVLGSKFQTTVAAELGSEELPRGYGGTCECREIGGCFSHLTPIDHPWARGHAHEVSPNVKEEQHVDSAAAGVDTAGAANEVRVAIDDNEQPVYQSVHLRPKQHITIDIPIRSDAFGHQHAVDNEPLSTSLLEQSTLQRGTTASSTIDVAGTRNRAYSNALSVAGRERQNSSADGLEDYGSSSEALSPRGARSGSVVSMTSAGSSNALAENPLVWWEFSSSSRDIEFEVIFQHQEGLITVVPLNTVKHGNTRSRGCYTPPAGLSGVLKLTWINKASWYSSKTLKYRVGVKDTVTNVGHSVPSSTQVTPQHTARGL